MAYRLVIKVNGGACGDQRNAHIVAVPIGNLEDVTIRAQRLLQASIQLRVNARRTGKLLRLLGVTDRHLVGVFERNQGNFEAYQAIPVVLRLHW